MRILAIETSMGRTSIALALPGRGTTVKRIEAGRGQAEALAPLIGALMEEAGEAFKTIDRIAVSIGPGGFSGIRTGVAMGRGIALAARLPIVGATSFRIMAAAFEKTMDAPARYALAAPAGMSAIYCQVLARGGTPLSDIVALPPEAFAAFAAGKAEAIAGPAAAFLNEKGFSSLPVVGAGLYPDAEALAEIASALDPALDVPSPFYVREADAKPQTRHAVALATD